MPPKLRSRSNTPRKPASVKNTIRKNASSTKKKKVPRETTINTDNDAVDEEGFSLAKMEIASSEEESDNDNNVDPYSTIVPPVADNLLFSIEVKGGPNQAKIVSTLPPEDSSDGNSTEEEQITVQDHFSAVSKLYPNRKVEVMKSIRNFDLSHEHFNMGWRVDESSILKKSVVQFHGICICLINDTSIKKWICLAEWDCQKRRETSSTWFNLGSMYQTSSSARHLFEQHGIRAYKTTCEEEKRSASDSTYDYLTGSLLYKRNMNRLSRMLWAKMIICNNLPFCLVEKPETRAIFNLVCTSKMDSAFSVKALMHIIKEMYVHIQSKIITRISMVVSLRHLASLSLNVDIWMVKTTSKKYVGVRIYFVDEFFELETRLLAIREFNPSSEIRQSHKLGHLLQVWVQTVLKDYQLNEDHVFGSTTDGGSDVKSWGTTLMGANKVWEHCPPHHLARSVKSAVGDSDKPYPSTLTLGLLRESIVSIKQTTRMGSLFEELNKMQGIKRTLQTFRPHRFMGVYTMLTRFVECFPSVAEFFERSGEHFALEKEEEQLRKFTAILAPVAHLSTEMQSKRSPQGWLYIIHMCVLRAKKGQLNLDSPLAKHDDDESLFNGQLVGEALEMRKRLIDAVDARFFEARYLKFETDLAFDVQLYLHPAYKHFDYVPMLREVMNSKCRREGKLPPSVSEVNVQAALVRTKILEKTTNHILNALQEKMKRKEIDLDVDTGTKSMYKSNKTMSILMQTAKLAREPSKHHSDAVVLNQLVDHALLRYQEEKPPIMELLNPLKSYWKHVSDKHPIVCLVVPSVFSLPSSACPMELDFCLAGGMTTATRNNFSPETVEVARTTVDNGDLLDLPQVMEIAKADIKKFMPTSPFVSMALYDEETPSNAEGDNEYTIESPMLDTDTSSYSDL